MTGQDTVGQISALVADLDELYRDHGIPTAQAQLPSSATDPTDRARVVVVGQVGSGKTSLINAVLGHADLLPVQPTRHYFAVGTGDQPQARLHLLDGHVATVAVGDLAVASAEVDDTVDYVEVALDVPALASLTLFDTPGVGGLDPRTGAVALDALQQATALVFVCATGGKLSLAERDFLAEAAGLIDHVVFVQTKTDVADDGGEANLGENAEVLQQRLAPDQRRGMTILGVSAHLALAGDPAAEAESNIAALRDILAAIADTHALHAQRNALRQIRTSIAAARTEFAARRDARRDDSGEADAIFRMVTERIKALKIHRMEWKSAMSELLTEAQWKADDARERRQRELSADYAKRVSEAKSDEDFAAIETSIILDLVAWQRHTTATIDEQLTELGDRLTKGLCVVDIEALTASLAGSHRSAAECLREETERPTNHADTFAAIQSTYLATMMSANVANAVGHAVLGAATGGVSLAAAAPAGLVLYGLQRHLGVRTARRADLQRRIDAAIADARALIATDTVRRFRRSDWALVKAFDKSLTDATAQATAEQKALSENQQHEATQDDRNERLDRRLYEVTKRWEMLHDGVLALGAAPAPQELAAPNDRTGD